ncbi:hypothetical protein ACOMHN_029055 [Nucella lapillus]
MKHNRGPKLTSVDTELLNWFAAIRKAVVYKLLAHVNAGKSAKDFKPSLLDAVCVLKQSWDKFTPATIANSFGKAGFIKSDGADDTLDDHNPKDHEEQEPLLARLFAEWNIDPSEYVSVDDDVATEEPATCASAPSTSTDTVDEEASDEEDNCGKGHERISTNSALDCVEKLKKFCLQSGCSDDIMSPFNEFSDLLEKHIASLKSQSSITDFFRAMQKEKGNTHDVGEDRTGEEEREEWMKEDTGGKKEWKDGMEEDRGKEEWKDGMEEDRGKKEWKDGMEEDRGKKEWKDGMEEDRGKEEGKDGMEEDRGKEEWKDGMEEDRGKKEWKDGMEEDRGKEEGKDGMEEHRGKEEGMEEMVDDVQFKGRGQEPTQSFMPTTAAWRMQQSRRLALPAPTTLPERQAKGELGIPTKVDNIVGDGNCLYRALSFEVCGTQ